MLQCFQGAETWSTAAVVGKPWVIDMFNVGNRESTSKTTSQCRIKVMLSQHLLVQVIKILWIRLLNVIHTCFFSLSRWKPAWWGYTCYTTQAHQLLYRNLHGAAGTATGYKMIITSLHRNILLMRNCTQDPVDQFILYIIYIYVIWIFIYIYI